ncbi:Transcriptional regulator, contains XRE-family HTH domain [Blastococcus aurantiacus]|uniref:Transcriptional regulator, contains XRE-family HTH domain n=2 Tax=Blastococcus aurantiacus TaxID=1550231 RepID=A0A1G7HKH4_9ACTN|nr:Transcriptional regulator, contains XRE-family HTH domain [Blastococcus aurantiacus]
MSGAHTRARDNELGDFLRAQRARITPEAAGLRSVGSRRVTGLRREEVAVLAGVSSDYYARLEQGRERAPSPQLMEAVARALQLGADARDHAFRLARLAPTTRATEEQLSPHLRQLLNSFSKAAAYVVNPAFRVIAANEIAAGLIAPAHHDGKVLEYLFLDPTAPTYFVHWDDVAHASVRGIRLSAGFSPPHPEVAALVRRLYVRSPAFAAIWDAHEVAGLTTVHMHIRHPAVGDLELSYQTFDVRESPGLQLTVASAAPGSPSEDALALLGTIEATERGGYGFPTVGPSPQVTRTQEST